MLCRHGRSAFMGGVHVFPGGKVDREDRDSAWRERFDLPTNEMAELLGEEESDILLGLWVAAIRETFEEAGVLLARSAGGIDLAAERRRMEEGISFSRVAIDVDLEIATTALTPYARWVTPEIESRRFDTRFFIAVLPEGQRASHDGTETTSAAWLSPSAALDRMRAGEIKLAPPTVRTLAWLADFDTVSAAIADAASRKPPLVRPEVVSGKEGWFLALPGDAAHSEAQKALPGSTRMVLRQGVWVDVDEAVG
jgi:8-oxo-dGTP pyrophosphatase MutT (NUDIX family)